MNRCEISDLTPDWTLRVYCHSKTYIYFPSQRKKPTLSSPLFKLGSLSGSLSQISSRPSARLTAELGMPACVLSAVRAGRVSPREQAHAFIVTVR